MSYKILLSKQSIKDRIELQKEGYDGKIEKILSELSENPAAPPSKRLKGEVDFLYSRRLNLRDRIVYEIRNEDIDGYDGTVRVIRMRTHYKGIIPLFLL